MKFGVGGGFCEGGRAGMRSLMLSRARGEEKYHRQRMTTGEKQRMSGKAA